MRIEKNDIVCGLPAPSIRDVMQLFRSPKLLILRHVLRRGGF
jgi:hypothetical protein